MTSAFPPVESGPIDAVGVRVSIHPLCSLIEDTAPSVLLGTPEERRRHDEPVRFDVETGA